VCEANAYIDHNGQEQLYMESVDIIKPEADNRLLIMDIFGDQKILHGKIKKISLVNHKILLEEIK
jgi:predicted RNA-binding protein